MENQSHSSRNHDPILLDAVKKQMEYYFSKENLQSDVFLTSQMDAQLSVPISTVMKFAKLKALTQDEELVRHALVDSTVVSIIDNKIRANIRPSNRSTIILREIPSDAEEKEVREIFNYEGCKNILSIRSDIGDTWYSLCLLFVPDFIFVVPHQVCCNGIRRRC
jgi:la-related protein 4